MPFLSQLFLYTTPLHFSEKKSNLVMAQPRIYRIEIPTKRT